MTEFSGTLEGVGLPAIVRFLSGLQKTGCLRITHQDWGGEIFFDGGQILSARLGSRKGLSALDALVQALPGASFIFDADARLTDQTNVQLSRPALLAHLDELAERSASGGPTLPSLDVVPLVVAQDESAAEETVPLDRGTVQTLLAIDGKRSVRDIISARGSFEALWQIANLAQVGLVRLPPIEHAPVLPVPPVPPAPVAAPPAPVAAPPLTARPTTNPRLSPTPPRAREVKPGLVRPEPTVTRPEPTALRPEPLVTPPEPKTARSDTTLIRPEPTTAVVHCPKLGFEDDPASSFGRPTRLHRCFAAGAPLPLSLDQQRELCLSDQYSTCPRLTMAGLAPSRPAVERPAAPPSAARPVEPIAPSVAQPEPAPADDPRIVRLPVGGRPASPNRVAASADPSGTVVEPARLRPATPTSPPTPREVPSPLPTPLRGRPFRANAATASVVDSPTADTERSSPAGPAELVTPDDRTATRPGRRALFNLPVPPATLAAGAMVLMVLAVVGVLLAPHAGDLFVDETSVDMSALPNTNAAIAGTPVTELTAVRAATSAPDATTTSAATPATGAAPASAPASVSGAATSAPRATTPPTSAPQPTTPPATAAPAGPRSLLDESFDTNDRNWPNNPQGTAWVTGGSYRIQPRQAGQFVAIGVPAVGEILQDVIVNASFRKLDGPAGGGYGIIVRDQGPGPRDGANQQGRYYVLEVGDKGEVGIWRREGDRWIDLLPWQRSDAVKPGNAANELTVKAIGDKLTLSVNGTEVGTKNDSTLAVGNIGIFVGGDGNQVALDQLTVQAP